MSVIHLSKPKRVSVPVSVKPSDPSTKRKPNSGIWWNHHRHDKKYSLDDNGDVVGICQARSTFTMRTSLNSRMFVYVDDSCHGNAGIHLCSRTEAGFIKKLKPVLINGSRSVTQTGQWYELWHREKTSKPVDYHGCELIGSRGSWTPPPCYGR